MEMTIDEIIAKENEIAAEFQKVVDTHIVNDNGYTIDEMYCDDTEVVEEHLSRCKSLADYHKQIADTMRKYQKVEDIYYHQSGEALENSLRAVIEDGDDE
jgi:hypothetical protein